jgi:hypothetical protein
MKSINQIFRSNPNLLNEPEVEELIEYIYELETQVMEHTTNSKYSREVDLEETIRDIFTSCKGILVEDEESQRFREIPPPDFREAIISLKGYIIDQCEYYKIRL